MGQHIRSTRPNTARQTIRRSGTQRRKAIRQRGGRQYGGRRFSRLFEQLEPRLVLATVSLSGGDLSIDGAVGFSEDITISSSGGNLLVSDPDGITAGANVTQVDPQTVSAVLASITGTVSVDTGSGLDSLTIESVDLQQAAIATSGVETVTVSSGGTLVAAGGVDLTGHTITVEGNATISTRSLPVGADPLTASSTGNSGPLTLYAHAIEVQPGGQLLAQVEAGSPYTAGKVSIKVDASTTALPYLPQFDLVSLPITLGGTGTRTRIQAGEVEIEATIKNDITSPQRFLAFTRETVDINIVNTTIEAESVSVVADSQDKSLLSDLPQWLTANVIQPVGKLLLKKFLPPTPLSAMIRGATAKVTLQDSEIYSDGNVILSSTTSVDATTEAVASEDEKFKKLPQHFSAGYSQADGDSETTLSGNTLIDSGGSVSVLSNAKTTAVVTARTTSNIDLKSSANAKNLVASLAITNSSSKSHATVEDGVSITAAGNVSVNSTGTVSNRAGSGATSYVDGLGGLSVSLAFDSSDVQAVVDGHIVASGQEVVRDLILADVVNNTITIPNHGFTDGESVRYFARDPDNPNVALQPIGGLLSGELLHVLVLDADTIQLARATAMEVDNTGAIAGAAQSFSPRVAVIFDPQTAVDPMSNTITIPAHGFTAGQKLDYGAGTPDDEAIGGLVDQNSYYAIPTGPDTFQVAATAADATATIPVPISLTGTGVGTSHILAYNQSPQTFDPVADFDNATDTFTIPAHGFSTGEALVYDIDPSISNRQTMNRTALFNPADLVQVFDPKGTADLGELVVNLSTDTLALVNHGLSTGDEVVYQTNGGDPIGGLNDGTPYYVIKVDDRYIQLAATPADASNATAIDLEAGASLGMGPQELVTTGMSPTAIAFDPTGDVLEPVVNTQSDTILLPPLHNLVAGQRVTYSTAGGNPIGGLFNNTDYFAIPVTEQTVRLASSRQNALDGIALPLSNGATGSSHQLVSNSIDVVSDLIVSPGHGLATGQQVTYLDGDGNPIGNLTNAATYYVIALDENTVQLAASLGDSATATAVDLQPGASGTSQGLETDHLVTIFDPSRTAPSVDTMADTIELPDHGLTTGDQVNYQASGGDPIGGLADDTNYFAIVTDANHIQLANTASEALMGMQIDLLGGASLGAGLHVLRVVPQVSIPEFPDRLIAFDPTLVPPLDTMADTIRLVNHGLTTGEAVNYLSGTGVAIGGLTNGAQYFVIAVDTDTVKLAATALDATNGIAQDLLPGATGDQHGLERMSFVTQTDLALRGLTSTTTYFAVVLDANRFRLSTSQQDALATTAITLDPSQATGTTHSLKPIDESTGIQISANLTADNRATSGAGIGGQPAIADLLTKAELQTSLNGIAGILKGDFVKRFNGGNENVAPTGTTTNGIFSGSAGVSVNSFDHTVLAQVGSTAVLDSDGDVAVKATATQKAQVTSQGNVMMGSAKKFATGVAVALGFYENTVQAIVDGDGTSGASIDADQNVDISSSLTYPLLVQPLTLLPFSGFFTGQFNPNFISTLASFLNGSLGLTRIMNVWSASKVFSTDADKLPTVSVSGSIGYTEFTNRSEALVRGGATINQNQQNSEQQVSVEADTTMQLVNVTGIMHLGLNEAGLRKAFVDRDQVSSFFGFGNFFSFFGNKSSSFGVGGSVNVLFLDNTTTAEVDGGAQIYSGLNGGLTVSSNQDVYSLEFAQSGGESGSIGISGSIAWVDQTSQTIAQLASGVNVTGGPVTVTADDQTTHTNIAGSAQLAKRLGVGVGVAFIDADRQTAAIIGKRRTETDDSIGSAGTSLDVTDVILKATSSGSLWSFGLVGALASNIPVGKTSAKNAESGSVKATSGVALAGDVAVNTITESTQAYINDDGNFQTQSVGLTSGDTTSISVFTGAGAMAVKPDGTIGAAVAGSFSYNDLQLTTKSFLAGATMPQTDGVTLDATADNELLAISGGLAGALAKSAVTIAGSLSWNVINSTVQAYLDRAVINPSGDVALTVGDKSRIEADGGAASIAISRGAMGLSGAVAFGVSAAVNDLTSNVKAYLTDATVTLADSLTLMADGQPKITAITWAGAVTGAASGMSGLQLTGAGAGSGNTITSVVEATIENGSNVSTTAGGDVALSATSTPTIEANAGGVAVTVELNMGTNVPVAIGAAASNNELSGGSTKAAIEGSTVDAAGNVSLTTTYSPTIEAISISLSVGAAMSGGAGAGISLDGAGAGSGNTIRDTSTALITAGSSVTTRNGSVRLSAVDTSHITAVAPAIALAFVFTESTAFSLEVGVSVTSNDIANTLQANIDNSMVTSAVDVSLSTTSMSTNDSVAVAATPSLTISNAASLTVSGVGASSYNTIANDAAATITTGSEVDAAGSVLLTTTEDAAITANVVSATLNINAGTTATGQVEIAVALATNTIGTDATPNRARAIIDDSTVVGADGVHVSATSTANIDALTVGISAGISVTSGASISVSGFGANTTNSVRNQVEAAITGTSDVTATTGNVSLEAAEEGDAAISAKATGGGLNVGVGADSFGGAVTVGAVLTTNDVGDTVQAHVDEATVSAGGNVTLDARAAVDVESLTVFVSLDVAFGAGGGLTATGDGANSTNSIHNTVEAYIVDSSQSITTTNGGNVQLTATDTPTITAHAGGGNMSLAFSSSFSGSIAVGAVLATNSIENTSQTYISNSHVEPAGDVELTTVSNPKISSLTVAVAISGSGSADGVSASAAVAASTATNTVNNSVLATIEGSTILAGGMVGVSATAEAADTNPNVQATVPAVSVSLAGTDPMAGVAVDLSGAGGSAVNSTTNTIAASITDNSTVTSSGTVTVAAVDTMEVKATVVDVTVNVSEFAASIAVALATNTIADQVSSFISQSDVTSSNAGITVSAESTPTATALTVAVSVSISIGASGAGSNATSNIQGAVEAYVDDQAVLSAPAGMVAVTSTSTATATATSTGGSAAALTIDAFLANATIGQSTTAYLSGGASVSAGGLNVTADATQAHATANVVVVGVGAVAGNGGNATSEITGDVVAYVGTASGTTPPAMPVVVQLGTGMATIQALSESTTADSDSSGGTLGLVDVTVMVPSATVSGDTRAYVGEGATIGAGGLTVNADATLTVNATSTVVGIGSYTGAGVSAVAEISNDSQTEAYVGPASGTTASGVPTTISLTTGDLKVRALLMGSADTTVSQGTAGVVGDGAGTVVDSEMSGIVRSYLGDNAHVSTASDVYIEANSQSEATATSFGLAVAGGLAAFGTKSTANLTPTLSTFTGAGVSIIANNVTLRSAHNVDASGNALSGKQATGNGTAGTGGLLASGAGANVVAAASPTITTTLGSGSTVTAQGTVDLLAVSYQDVATVAKSETASFGIGVGATLATGTAAGQVQSIVEGTIASAQQVTVHTDVNAYVDAYGEANGGGLLLEGNGTQVKSFVGDTGQTLAAALIRGTGSITASGNVTIESLVESVATSESSAIVVSGGVSVGSIPAQATLQPVVRAELQDAAQVKSSAGGVTILAAHNYDAITPKFLADNQATVTTTLSSGSIGVNVDDTTVTATSQADVQAITSSSSMLSAPAGHVTIEASSSNLADADLSNKGGALISYSQGVPKSFTTGTTKALVQGNVVGVPIGANQLTVRAQAQDLANSKLNQDGGGGISVQNSRAEATSSPHVSALLGGNVTTTAQVTVQANSSTDADATITNKSGGAINVSDYDATVTVGAVVTADIADDAQVVSGGKVTVSGTHGKTAAPLSDGTFDADMDVDPTANTISFSEDHGLLTGDNVTYDDLGQLTIPGLENGREYSVIVGNDPKSLQLGISFNQQVVDTDDSSLNFARSQNLAIGDAVEYEVSSGTGIGGLVAGNKYVVHSVNPYKVVALYQGAATFDTATNTITQSGGAGFDVDGFQAGQVITVLGTTFNNGNFQIQAVTPTVLTLSPLTPVLANESAATADIGSTAQSIKLAEPGAVSTTFTGADVAMDTISVAGHGLTNGQALEYEAPPFAPFSSRQVDITESMGMYMMDPSAENIYLGAAAINAAGLVNGAVVQYVSADPSLPIAPLVSGQRYVVIFDSGKPDEIQLAPQASPGTPLMLDGSAIAAEVVHSLTVVTNLPIGGLTNRSTYYVTSATAGTFQLAPTEADAIMGTNIIPLDPLDPVTMTTLTGTQTLHPIVNLTSPGNGQNQLIIDIAAKSSGTQELIGVGGAGSLAAATSGNGIATASVSGSSGAVVDVASADTTATATPSTMVTVHDGASITAGSISVISFSAGNVAGSSANGSGGFVSVGEANSSVSVNNSSITLIDDSAMLRAAGDLTVTSTTSEQATDTTSTDGGGFVDYATSRAKANVDYTSQVQVNPSARLMSGNLLTLRSQSDLVAQTTTTADAAGLGGNADANDNGNYGVFVGNSSALTQTVISDGAQLFGDAVQLDAVVTNMQGYSSSKAEADAFGADSDSEAKVQVNDRTEVVLDGGAVIRGDTILIQSLHQNVNVSTYSESKCDCFGGDSDATANTNYNSTSAVTGNQNAILQTASLRVVADQDVSYYNRNPVTKGAFIDFGHADKEGSFNANRQITWNSTVQLPGNPSPQLLVDNTGLVVTADDVTLNGGMYQQGDTIPFGATIIVDDIINSQGGTATFEANDPGTHDGKSPPKGMISGSMGLFEFHRTLSSIVLQNDSPRDMRINDIQVAFAPSTSDVEITIDVQQDNNFQFDVLDDFDPTSVLIENTDPTNAPLLELNGTIDNPIGTTTISNASGDIVSLSPSATIVTKNLTLTAPDGNLGAPGAPIQVELVQSQGFPTHLLAGAGGNITMDVQGVLRETGVMDFQPNIDLIQAGGTVDLVLLEGLLQTTEPAVGVGIEVEETNRVSVYPAISVPPASANSPPRITTVETHWPPPANDDPPATALGLFGTGTTTVDTTYTLTGQFDNNSAMEPRRIQAGDNIHITGCDTSGCVPSSSAVNLLGNVTLSDPLSGTLNVATNGFIDLTEVAVPVGSNRAMRVGVIESAANYVQLTVPDTLATGEDLLLFDSSAVMPDGSRINAATSVTLHVGDNVIMPGNVLMPTGSSEINAGTTVEIDGDYTNADPGVGTVIDLRGLISGNLSGSISDPNDLKQVVWITGQGDADIVSLTNVTSGSGTTVETMGQSDTIQVGTNAQVDVSVLPPVATNSGGLLHAVQDLLTVNGGDGDDVLSADDSGDTLADAGVLTFETITGFQMTGGIRYLDIEDLTITMGQAGDTLDVDSTNAATDSQVYGNAGEDVVNVAKLVSPPATAPSCPSTADTVDCVLGVLRVFGGPDYDFLNVIDTGQTSSRSGTLTGTAVTGLNMGPQGVLYQETEAVDILLGQAADDFTVASTAAAQGNGNTTISAVHGGGGSDTLTVTGGGGSQSPLVIYGDYTNTGTPASDTIDASASSLPVMIDGNEGDDQITGSQAGDNLAGSAGNDTINAQDGPDNVLGDSGFEVDLRTRITMIITSHAAGQDQLNGQDGPDRIFGDHAVLVPVPGALLVTTATDLIRVETVNESVGAADRISGGTGDDMLLGGEGDDTLFGNEGNDSVLGDNGQFDYLAVVSPPSIVAQYTPHRQFGGNDNIFGDSGNDNDPAGNDILYDGPQDDELDGGPGDDTFRLEPGNESLADGSHDYLSDIRGSDTVDFTYAMLASRCVVPATATDLCGIMIDMDLVGFAQDAFSQQGPAFRQPITDDVSQQVPQDMTIDDQVSMLRVGAFGQTEDTPSPFENVIGTNFNDTFWIRALATGGDIPENGPPVLRNVNGNPPVIGDPAVPPGDKLWFDAEGQPVIDTGFSITAQGIGTVTYQSIENLMAFDQAPRIIDDGDDPFRLNPNSAVPNVDYYTNWNQLNNAGFNGEYLFNFADGGAHDATWLFQGLLPGKYRVSVTYPDNVNNPNLTEISSDSPFTVLDDDFALATEDVDQRLAPREFQDEGVFWNDLGIYEVTSHTLTVRLTDNANATVQADAVRIEQLSAEGPALEVLQHDNSRIMRSGISRVPMETTLGTPLTETFTIRNLGDADLLINDIQLAPNPADNLTLIPPPLPYPVTVSPGESTTFSVRLDGDPAEGFGFFQAQVRIFSNDMMYDVPRKPGAGDPNPGSPGMDVDPFTFDIRGEVLNRLIVDSGDPDFSLVGVWQGPNGTGYEDDDRWTPGDGRGNRAIWTFHDLPDGTYRVSTSYVAEPANNASTNSPFTVSNATQVIGALSVDQTLNPNDFFADGTYWEDLGGPYSVTDGTLVVQLLDTAGQPSRYVIADAVRVERLANQEPDIRVEVDGQVIGDDIGVVDFGSTMPGSEVTKTFTVTNVGVGSLTVSEPLVIPPGFSLVEFDGQVPTGMLTATAPTTFKLRLDAGGPGSFRDEVSLPNSDPNEDPFNFIVAADVESSRIIDDQDLTGFTASPGFQLFTNNNQGYQGRVHFASGDGNGDQATWTFDNLTEGAPYLVSVTWSPSENRASNAPFTVAGVAGGATTVLLDQQITPDDRAVNGTVFEDLGVFTVVGGSTLTVTLGDNANATVIADAVRIEPAVNPILVVMQGGGELIDGQDSVDFGTASLAAGQTVDRVFTLINRGGRPMALGVPQLPVGYEVVGDFPNSIAAGGTATFTIGLRRDLAGAYRGTLVLGNDDLVKNPFRVELSGNIVATGWIIDNQDGAPGFTEIGFDPFGGQGRQGSVEAAAAGNGSAKANFLFSGLAPGLYRISTTWPTASNRATDAPFTVFDGTTTDPLLLRSELNQRIAPNDFVDAGSVWEDIGFVRISGPTLSVQLNNDANNYVIADAVRVEPLPGQPEIRVEDSLGNPIASGGLFDFGTIAPDATTTETFTIRNFGDVDLVVGVPRLPASFSLITPPATLVAANSSTSFQVRFEPSRVDTFTGAIRWDNNDSNENPFEFRLRGAAFVTAPIIDDGDPGYSDTGFTVFNNQGYGGDVRQSAPGAGNTATWTFTGLSANTSYKVSATWTGFSNRATNAPYTLGGIANGDVTVTVNQQLSPGDFVDQGAAWQNLAVVRTTGSTLTVTLSDDANGFVIADAIRIEPLTANDGPELLLARDAREVKDDTGSVAFGATNLGTSTSETFTITNMGAAPLQLAPVLTLPPGFSLGTVSPPGLFDGGASSLSLAPGDTATLEVLLDGAAVGTFQGTLSFDNGDADENPYDFAIAGTVVPAVTIIDNNTPGYSDSGNLSYWTNQGFNSNLREAPTGGAVESASYQFTGLQPGDVYQVSATYTAYTNRATNATYTVSGVQNGPSTVSLNQRLVPNDLHDQGFGWENLGTYRVGAGGVITVQLAGSTTGNVIADAVRIERLVNAEIQVTLDGSPLSSGSSIVDFGNVLSGATSSRIFTLQNVGAADLTLQPIVVPAGYTLLSPNFTVGQIVAPGNQVQFEIAIDATTLGAKSGTVSIGNNDGDESPFSFQLQGQVVVALVIDNLDSGFTASNSFGYFGGQGYAGSVLAEFGPNGGDAATWTFANLSAGTYRVSATWSPYSNRATNAPFSINGGIPIPINQRLAPNDPTFTSVPVGATHFADLSVTAVPVGGTLTVSLSDGSINGWIIADAIRIERLGPLLVEANSPTPAGPPAIVLDAPTIGPLLAAAADYWQSIVPEAAQRLRDVQVIVRDLPPSTLGLASFTSPTIWLDDDAAGWGWNSGATDGQSIHAGRVDLLSVLRHELGHVLGLPDLNPLEHPDHVMAATLPLIEQLSQPPIARQHDAVDHLFSDSSMFEE